MLPLGAINFDSGVYTLCLNSGDGSRLFLDGVLKINNDGLHEMTKKCYTALLDAGSRDFIIQFFEYNGYGGLEFTWIKPGDLVETVVPDSAFVLPKPSSVPSGIPSLSPTLSAAPTISAAPTSTYRHYVWGVDIENNVYSRNGVNGSWTKVDGKFKQVSVSADGSDLWGVNTSDEIYYRNGKDGNWIRIAGHLKQVSVSDDGNHVWGVNSADHIYHRHGASGSWKKIDGYLREISVSGDGNHIWGVNASGNLYHRNGVNGKWQHIDVKFQQVSVNGDGSGVYGVNSNDVYYRNGENGSWQHVSSSVSFKYVSVAGYLAPPPSSSGTTMTYTFPKTETPQFIHGLCLKGASVARGFSSDSALTYTPVENFRTGMQMWGDRGYKSSDIKGEEMCEGGLYLRPSLIKVRVNDIIMRVLVLLFELYL